MLHQLTTMNAPNVPDPADSVPKVDLAALRQKLASGNGKEYWRTLEDLADTDEFRQFLAEEFPNGKETAGAGFDRRAFVKLMGASFALAGLSACGPGPEKIV
ncbi:MAG: TAT-variant-translocated molybdopterin oxidoreductase, partial [Candidatus Poribacteria bacterium]|nr:TAT-variant-translocated molybdopterin oxidoreductase [Candidatus Poribacteria bacterium]